MLFGKTIAVWFAAETSAQRMRFATIEADSRVG